MITLKHDDIQLIKQLYKWLTTLISKYPIKMIGKNKLFQKEANACHDSCINVMNDLRKRRELKAKESDLARIVYTALRLRQSLADDGKEPKFQVKIMKIISSFPFVTSDFVTNLSNYLPNKSKGGLTNLHTELDNIVVIKETARSIQAIKSEVYNEEFRIIEGIMNKLKELMPSALQNEFDQNCKSQENIVRTNNLALDKSMQNLTLLQNDFENQKRLLLSDSKVISYKEVKYEEESCFDKGYRCRLGCNHTVTADQPIYGIKNAQEKQQDQQKFNQEQIEFYRKANEMKSEIARLTDIGKNSSAGLDRLVKERNEYKEYANLLGKLINLLKPKRNMAVNYDTIRLPEKRIELFKLCAKLYLSAKCDSLIEVLKIVLTLPGSPSITNMMLFAEQLKQIDPEAVKTLLFTLKEAKDFPDKEYYVVLLTEKFLKNSVDSVDIGNLMDSIGLNQLENDSIAPLGEIIAKNIDNPNLKDEIQSWKNEKDNKIKREKIYCFMGRMIPLTSRFPLEKQVSFDNNAYRNETISDLPSPTFSIN